MVQSRKEEVAPMSTRLVPLGTNGFIPTEGRQTMSFLVLAAEQAILLDTGSGVARLLETPLASLIEPYPVLNIVYSHYHLDHLVGLSYLTAAWPAKPVHIYAPERPLLDAAAEETLNGLIRPPYFPLTLQQFPCPVSIVPVRDETLAVGSVAMRLRAQKHSGGSVGMRIGDELAYTTDTVVDDGTIDFVRGVKLLLHELWLDGAQAATEAARTGHSHAGGVTQIAAQAGVGRLMIVHHHPRRSWAEITQTARTWQRATGVSIVVPEEGTVYEV
jgi:ribonuclease BN (tRNA processing enzyme)